jgi:predicted Ser/Thr protein kinase
MPAATLPPDELERLATLASCRIVGTPKEKGFDDIVLVASLLAGVPIAFVSFIEAERQWFKAKVGLPVDETPRELSFCGHAILQPEPLVVPDAREDERFSDNPLVRMGIRFYAGIPIRVDRGSAIGTLCVLDFEPRTLSEKQVKSLEALARQIARELSSRREPAEPSSSPDTPRGLARGEEVGAWRVERFIGSGAFGTVYEAHGTGRNAGRRAALKVLLAESNVERFVREARILMRVESPHVAKLYDVGNLPETHGGSPYLALEYLDGSDLGRLIEERGRFAWREAAAWVADACEGIAGAHALGVIHRDLKPANLVLASNAVKVIDFGIAKMDPVNDDEPPLSRAGMVLGSPQYMPPEQLLSSSTVDPRSDVWSMGVTLYELVTGTLPFDGGSELEIVSRVLSQTPAPMRDALPAVPPDLDRLVSRCLAKERADRPASMLDLAAALRVILTSA